MQQVVLPSNYSKEQNACCTRCSEGENNDGNITIESRGIHIEDFTRRRTRLWCIAGMNSRVNDGLVQLSRSHHTLHRYKIGHICLQCALHSCVLITDVWLFTIFLLLLLLEESNNFNEHQVCSCTRKICVLTTHREALNESNVMFDP